MRTNQRAQHCNNCGVLVQSGKGNLVLENKIHGFMDDCECGNYGGPNTECLDKKQYNVYCTDITACKERGSK